LRADDEAHTAAAATSTTTTAASVETVFQLRAPGDDRRNEGLAVATVAAIAAIATAPSDDPDSRARQRSGREARPREQQPETTPATAAAAGSIMAGIGEDDAVDAIGTPRSGPAIEAPASPGAGEYEGQFGQNPPATANGAAFATASRLRPAATLAAMGAAGTLGVLATASAATPAAGALGRCRRAAALGWAAAMATANAARPRLCEGRFARQQRHGKCRGDRQRHEDPGDRRGRCPGTSDANVTPSG